jgi:hypothetical protein
LWLCQLVLAKPSLLLLSCTTTSDGFQRVYILTTFTQGPMLCLNFEEFNVEWWQGFLLLPWSYAYWSIKFPLMGCTCYVFFTCRKDCLHSTIKAFGGATDWSLP